MTLRLISNGAKYLQATNRLKLLGPRYLGSLAKTAAEEYEPGQKIQGYTVEKVVPVSELYLTSVLLSHDITKAQHLHVSREDSDNVFGVAFRTTPMDSTGVPHILEHTSLCGSQKFPVRDPFFKMLTRSLNTFMNAFTASDWTMYPFSTQNRQDFQNLLAIYLDAAFFPRLRELDFMQEGWRLEHENPQDPNSPIIFKGVVYNEMKGVFSSSQSVYCQKVQNLLLPSHTYSVVSGGDPANIPDLTWQQLQDFHSTHYHPSNARFYTYGNFPLEEHLEFINNRVLDKFGNIDPNTSVPSESRWSQPREASISCMPDPMAPDPEKQITFSINYLLDDVTDPYESFTLGIIGSLLVNGEKSPFYQSLLEANIGSDFSPMTGYEGDKRNGSFSVGLQGIHSEDVTKVKEIIEETFDKVIREGFEQERIDAILHKIELGQKNQSNKFGLHLGINLLPCWIHDGDPTQLLQVNSMVTKFKQCLHDNPRYLQEKVSQYFKENPHKLTLVMSPDENFEEKLQQEENSKLQQKIEALTEQDKKDIYEKGLALLSEQMQEEDLSSLPTLQVSDIQPTTNKVNIEKVTTGNTVLQLCSQPTNGVTYFRAIADISGLDPKLLPYVPLFCTVVTGMGAGDMDYKELSQKIDLMTGGLSAGPHIAGHHTLPDTIEQGITFSSYCLDRNVDSMYQLWQEIFNRLDMSDTIRMMTLILMTASDLANSLVGSGHQYAITHATSSLSPGGQLKEQMGGMSQVSLMKSIAESQDLTAAVQALQAIASHVLQNAKIRCALNATPGNMVSAQKSTEKFIQNITSDVGNHTNDFFHSVSDFAPVTKWTHFELPFQVNFVARSSRTVPYTHKDFASLRILATMMGTKYLHREIREKGGAYGGGAVGSSAGQFSFYSYRDPNMENTLQAFEGAIIWVEEGRFTQQDIDESKLAIFSQVDGPVPPGHQGLREFLHSISHDVFQRHREELFQVTKEDLIRVSQQYLSPETRTSSVSLLGQHNPFTTENPSWNIIRQS